MLRDSSDPTKQSASLEWREVSICAKAVLLPFIHTCITQRTRHCMARSFLQGLLQEKVEEHSWMPNGGKT